MKASEYQDIGHYLRDSRESLRISVAEAAAALHIREKYLLAIETGELKDLPGKAYIRGYIKNYVEFLRLDAKEVLEAYEALLSQKGHDFFIPETTLKENLPSGALIGWTLLGLALLYSYWYFNLHDTTDIAANTPDLPEKFAQLLDKTELAAMDKAWEDCLNADDPDCFRMLRFKAAIPVNRALYDFGTSDDSEAQKP